MQKAATGEHLNRFLKFFFYATAISFVYLDSQDRLHKIYSRVVYLR